MATKQSFSELRNSVEEFAQGCYDHYSDTREMAFEAPNRLAYMVGDEEGNSAVGSLFANVEVATKGQAEAPMNMHAFSQLVGRLDGPPMRWLANDQRCPADLRQDIMNALLKWRDNTRLFLRHNSEGMRAVLSDQYTPFDNGLFIDLVGQAVETLGVPCEINRATVGDELRAWILLPSITFAADPINEAPGLISGGSGQAELSGTFEQFNPSHSNNDGGLHPALYISNSEIGTGSARTHGGLYRYVCSNGLIWGWSSGEALKVRHRYISTGVMAAEIAAGIAAGLRMSEQAAKQFVAAQEVHIKKANLSDIVDEWAGRYGISIDAKESWLHSARAESSIYARRDDPRLFDIINGATYAAQGDERSEAERELMERMAGDMLQAGVSQRYLQTADFVTVR